LCRACAGVTLAAERGGLMKKIQKLFAIVGAVSALLIAGCAGSGSERSTGEVIDDTAIHTKVKTALLNDPVVHGLAIDVTVDRGIVGLSGAVNGNVEKRKAEEIARGVDGVRGVENKIIVRQ
jgi:hyperosmotically inducible periplasmic protein